MPAQYPSSPMQGPASPNDWLAQMRSQPQTWADVQGPAQMRPPNYPVVTPGHIPQAGVPGNAAASMPASGGMPMQNQMMGMGQAMMGGGQDEGAAQIIRDRQAMSQAGLDRMQQIAAMMRSRMGG